MLIFEKKTFEIVHLKMHPWDPPFRFPKTPMIYGTTLARELLFHAGANNSNNS